MRLDTYKTLSGGNCALSADGTTLSLSAPNKVGYDIPCKSLAIVASSTNAANLYVAASGFYGVAAPSAQGYSLAAGDSISLDIDNVNKVQIAGTNGDIVSWLAIVD